MKQKYTLTVAGQPLTFVSDEDREFVESIVSQTDKAITDIMMSSMRCARLDAALITALEYCSEKTKAEKRAKNLEAQISLYEATIARLKKDAEAKANENATPVDTNKESEIAVAEAPEKAASEEAPARRDGQIREIENIFRQRKAKEESEEKQLKLDEIASLLRK